MNSAAIVGYVDHLGYLRCVLCATRYERMDGYPVYADTAPHNTEPCDSCGLVTEA